MPTTAIPSRALFAVVGLMAAIIVTASAVACDDTTAPGPPTFVASLDGASEVPAKTVPGTGTATIVKSGSTYSYTITYTGMTGPLTGAHIHGPATATTNATVIVPFGTTGAGASGTLTGTFSSTNTAEISNDSLDVLMRTGGAYVNLHTAANIGGEIRGQLSQQP
jgi:Cu/Zn superoxide dismutase